MKFARALQFFNQGMLEEAESLCRTIARTHPKNFDAQHLLGLIALRRSNAEEAERQIRRAIQIAPNVAMAHNSRGIALKELKRLQEALESFNRALALQPHYPEALVNRGAAQHALNRFEEALASYDSALALQPNFAGAFANRANTLVELQRFEDALASTGRALALLPNYPEAHNARGLALYGLNRNKEAMASFDSALAIRPLYAEAFYNRGNALTELKQLDEAIADYDKAIALKPDLANAFLNRAHALLMVGRMAEGWRDAEQRWKTQSFTSRRPPISAPEWSGESLNGRSILVFSEQGYGDMIQFSRYVPLLAAQGCDVSFLVPPELHRLLSCFTSPAKIISSVDAGSRFDFQSALMSLPLHLGTELETVPASVPYLTAEPEKVAFWRERIGPHGFKIGICWQGNNAVLASRSFPVRVLQPLSQIDGVRLISLQKGSGLAQLDDLPAGMSVETLGEDFDKGADAFIDTAAVMQSLDLIVTCDTSIAHLAGALARPAWVALKFVPDWRWLLDRPDSPWYPTLRLYRQAAPGAWSPVFTSMSQDLEKLVRQG